jgi:chromosome condensin MukBEF ATPase and DNA-binding subunit MukB
LPSEPFSWEDHEQAICANVNDDEWFRQFIYSDPPSETKEERSEQIEQAEEEMEEVTERHATQTTANDLSSNTDVSIDDVMLVPTDVECSSP